MLLWKSRGVRRQGTEVAEASALSNSQERSAGGAYGYLEIGKSPNAWQTTILPSPPLPSAGPRVASPPHELSFPSARLTFSSTPQRLASILSAKTLLNTYQPAQSYPLQHLI